MNSHWLTRTSTGEIQVAQGWSGRQRTPRRSASTAKTRIGCHFLREDASSVPAPQVLADAPARTIDDLSATKLQQEQLFSWSRNFAALLTART